MPSSRLQTRRNCIQSALATRPAGVGHQTSSAAPIAANTTLAAEIWFGMTDDRASASVSSGSGNGAFIAALSPLGGLTNLSGFTENQLYAPQTGLARVIYYRRLTNAQQLFSVPVYLGGSLEAGGVWGSRDQFGNNVLGAGSIFLGVDTFLGPIFLGYGYAQGGRNSAYLTFGSLLRSDR